MNFLKVKYYFAITVFFFSLNFNFGQNLDRLNYQSFVEHNGSYYLYSDRTINRKNEGIILKLNQAFEPEWEYKIDSTIWGEHSDIKVIDNKIFFAAIVGYYAVGDNVSDLFLFKIDLNGNLISKIDLGSATTLSSNLVIDNNSIFIPFTYSKARIRTAYLTKINIETELFEVEKLNENTVFFGYSRKYGEKLFLLGYCSEYKDNYPYLVEIDPENLKQIKKIELPDNFFQFNLGAIYSVDSITVFSHINKDDYSQNISKIKINYLNSNFEIKNTVIYPYLKYGWEHIREIERHVNKENLFILAKKKNTSIYTSYLVEIDAKGNVINETYLDTKNTCCNQIYYIDENYLYVLYKDYELGKFMVESFKI